MPLCLPYDCCAALHIETLDCIYISNHICCSQGLRRLSCTGEGGVVPGAAGVVCAGESKKWLSSVQVARSGYLPSVEKRGTQRVKVCLEEDSAITWYGYGNGVPWNVGCRCVEYVGLVVANEKNNVRA